MNDELGYVCSFCSRKFPSLQALGGHQTAHRKEIEEMRQEHKAIVESKKVDHGGRSAVTLDLLDRWEEASRKCEDSMVSNLDPEQVEDKSLDLTLKL